MSHEFTLSLSPEQLERLQDSKNETYDFLFDIGEDADFAVRGASLILETNVTTREIPIEIGPADLYVDDFDPEEERLEPEQYSYDEPAGPSWQNLVSHPRFYFPYIIFYLLCFWLIIVHIVRCLFKVWHGMEFRRAVFTTLELIFNGILIFFFSLTIITAIHDISRNIFEWYSEEG